MDTANEYRINKLKSLKSGDTVYLVPYDNRNESCNRKILSVGKKWLKVDFLHRSENKFDVMDNYKHTPDLGSSSYVIHASCEDYHVYKNMIEEHSNLIKEIYLLQSKSDIEVLKKVIKKWNRILNKHNTTLNKDDL